MPMNPASPLITLSLSLAMRLVALGFDLVGEQGGSLFRPACREAVDEGGGDNVLGSGEILFGGACGNEIRTVDFEDGVGSLLGDHEAEGDVGPGHIETLGEGCEALDQKLLHDHLACVGQGNADMVVGTEYLKRVEQSWQVVVYAFRHLVPRTKAEDEVARLFLEGVVEDLLRGTVLPDDALVHVEHAGGYVAGE